MTLPDAYSGGDTTICVVISLNWPMSDVVGNAGALLDRDGALEDAAIEKTQASHQSEY